MNRYRLRSLIFVLLAIVAASSADAQTTTNPCRASGTDVVKDPKLLVFDRPTDPIVMSVEFLYYDSGDPARGPFFIGNRRFLSDAVLLFKGSDGVPDCIGYPWMPVTDVKKDGVTRYWSAVRGVDAQGRAGDASERGNPFFFAVPPPPLIPVLTGHRVAP